MNCSPICLRTSKGSLARPALGADNARGIRAEWYNAPDDNGGSHGIGKALGTRNCGGVTKSRRLEHSERKFAPRVRIQGFHARLRVYDAGRAGGRKDGSSSGLVEFLEQSDRGSLHPQRRRPNEK